MERPGQGGRKIGALKLKLKTGTPALKPAAKSSAEVKLVIENNNQSKIFKSDQQEPTKTQEINEPEHEKTAAQKAFELVKKKRLIHKANEKANMTNKQRLDKLNKKLSKLPDHNDLAKIGEKIQKGY